MFELTASLIADLQAFDTPTVCNALEIVAPERRGYGYTVEHLFCLRPQLKPVVAIARTARIRSVKPDPLTGAAARANLDAYFAYVDAGPKPCVVVMQDIDEPRGYGCLWGEVNSNIHFGLGCLGLITDGAVRDLPDIAPGFQMLANRVVPSHAFAHVVDFAGPVTVAGMSVSDGDLIHADQHGAVVIPHAVAAGVSAAALEIQRGEKAVIAAAREPGFSAAKLKSLMGGAVENH
jgi:regulator of RNase E activity RraA